MPAHAQTSTAAIVAAGRRLLEERGVDALTMRDVAEVVGVRAPSLYKRVRDRADLFRLILTEVVDEMSDAIDAAANSGDPVADLRALANTFRRFAHRNPVAHTLLFTPREVTGTPVESQRSTATLMRLVTELVGSDDALPAARTMVAWINGFVTMELAGAFRLGGDVDVAWDFGLDRLLAALR